MRTSSVVLAITLNLIVGRAALDQIADWRALFRDAANRQCERAHSREGDLDGGLGFVQAIIASPPLAER